MVNYEYLVCYLGVSQHDVALGAMLYPLTIHLSSASTGNLAWAVDSSLVGKTFLHDRLVSSYWGA